MKGRGNRSLAIGIAPYIHAELTVTLVDPMFESVPIRVRRDHQPGAVTCEIAQLIEVLPPPKRGDDVRPPAAVPGMHSRICSILEKGRSLRE